MTGAIPPIPPMNTEVYMSTTDETIEQEIQAKGLTAQRVTPADIEANIASEYYFTAADGYRSAPCFDPNGQPTDCLPPPRPAAPADLLRPGAQERLHRHRRERLRQP